MVAVWLVRGFRQVDLGGCAHLVCALLAREGCVKVVGHWLWKAQRNTPKSGGFSAELPAVGREQREPELSVGEQMHEAM